MLYSLSVTVCLQVFIMRLRLYTILLCVLVCVASCGRHRSADAVMNNDMALAWLPVNLDSARFYSEKVLSLVSKGSPEGALATNILGDISFSKSDYINAAGYYESVLQNSGNRVEWTDIFYTRNFLSSYSIFSNQLSSIVSRMSRYFSNDASKPIIVPPGRQQQLISIGVLVCSTPLIVLYCFAQRLFVESVALTGTKM